MCETGTECVQMTQILGESSAIFKLKGPMIMVCKVREDRVLTLHKNGSCSITQLLSQPKVSKSHRVISQETFCGVRTHFYHKAISYDMFRDLGVVELFDPQRAQHTCQNLLMCTAHVSKFAAVN